MIRFFLFALFIVALSGPAHSELPSCQTLLPNSNITATTSLDEITAICNQLGTPGLECLLDRTVMASDQTIERPGRETSVENQCLRWETKRVCVDRIICRVVCTAAGAAMGGVGGAVAGQVCSELCEAIPECRMQRVCVESVLEPRRPNE